MSLALSIREGRWKYLDHKGSGGNRYGEGTRLAPYTLPDADPEAPGQLYDLATDPGETQNLYSKKPESMWKNNIYAGDEGWNSEDDAPKPDKII